MRPRMATNEVAEKQCTCLLLLAAAGQGHPACVWHGWLLPGKSCWLMHMMEGIRQMYKRATPTKHSGIRPLCWTHRCCMSAFVVFCMQQVNLLVELSVGLSDRTQLMLQRLALRCMPFPILVPAQHLAVQLAHLCFSSCLFAKSLQHTPQARCACVKIIISARPFHKDDVKAPPLPGQPSGYCFGPWCHGGGPL